MFPLSAFPTAYFHSPQYAARVDAGLNSSPYRVDDAVRSRLEAGQAEALPLTTDGGTTSP
jgi:hypothetical protein